MNKFMTVSQIRDRFLEFYHSKGHTIVESSSLVPDNDPTLLFTNAGMNQFKDVFLGLEKRPYNRATTAQRCVRAGGKHNDLENVGYTARHHTFFEMLGNFSLADYFKEDAISFAWEFLTGKDNLGLDKAKLLVTVYAKDDEAYDIWHKKIGLPANQIIRIGDNKGAPFASDNFWQMGDTGPCGPSTEIFYDHGAHVAGGPPGSPDEDGDRFIEIWNLVFMQYSRHADGTLDKLPKPCVDTGMGLERVAAVMQGVDSNYDIDLFKDLIAKIANTLQVTNLTDRSLFVIADHIRSCSYLIADGVVPSNEGRGYVLRRIIRRAIRHGHKLGATDLFFYKLLPFVIEAMGSAASSLVKNKALIEATLQREEEQFLRTLDRGLSILNDILVNLTDNATLSGADAFKLYDTYGFPLDLITDVCRERNIKVDEAGFAVEMEAQKTRAKNSNKFTVSYEKLELTDEPTTFLGYEEATHTSTIKSIYTNNKAVNSIVSGDKAILVTDQTPFYAESGGQVGEQGRIVGPDGIFVVEDTKKQLGVFMHIGYVENGIFGVNDSIELAVNEKYRLASAKNHSATHLMHHALRTVLGTHVEQKGSLVKPDLLRFDFSHFRAITAEELTQIEILVNNYIRDNSKVTTQVMPIAEAKKLGAMALFSEKYGDEVRVVVMGKSIELCGGIHVNYTGDIGYFRIESESAIAAGVRRIEAVTGEQAILNSLAERKILHDTAREFDTDKTNVLSKITALKEQVKTLTATLNNYKSQGLKTLENELLQQAKNSIIVAHTGDLAAKDLRTLGQQMLQKVDCAILTAIDNDRIQVCISASKNSAYNANELIRELVAQFSGKGGGKADLAMGSIQDPAVLQSVLTAAQNIVG